MVSFFGFHRGLMRSVCFLLSFAFRWFLDCLRFPFFSFPFVFRFPMGAFAFRGFRFSSVLACLCVSFPGAACPLLWLPSFSVVGFSIGGFMSFVRLQVPFIDSFVSFLWLCLSSPFPVLHSFSSSRPFLARLACSFPFRGFRLRSGRFVFVLRFRLSASPRRDAPSGGGVGPIGQGCPQARGRPPRGWRGDAGPGSRTRAAMGGRGRRRRGGRRPMGSAGRRTRRSR